MINKFVRIFLFNFCVVSVIIAQGNDAEFETAKAKTLAEEIAEKESYNFHFDIGATTFFFTPFKEGNPNPRLDNKAAPIFLGEFNFDAAWRFFFIRGGTKTNFGIKTGEIQTGQNAIEQITKNHNLSYLLNASSGFWGIEIGGSVQDFNAGTVTQIETGLPNKTGAFQLNKKQADIRYHFLWNDIPRLGGTARKTKATDTYMGYRYLDYSQPMIIRAENYENLPASIPRAQMGRVTAHLGGFGANNYLKAVQQGFNLLYSIDLYLGKGSTVEGNTQIADYNKMYEYTIGMIGGSLGTLYNFDAPRSESKKNLKVLYSFDLYYLGGELFGSQPLFHNIAISFDMMF